jgi:acyl transferase domain-containing protein
VSSFGIGGTNAHVVLEAAPERAPSARARPWQVLPVSARTAEGLTQQCTQLAWAMVDTTLADAAYTLSVGRKAFRHRRAVVARGLSQAAQELEATAASGSEAEALEVALLFPGQGAQRVGMGAALYREGGAFAEAVRESAGALSALLGLDVLKLILEGDEAALGGTAAGQSALFAVSYGLAKQWEAWGVPGTVLLGHSLGEYVAACVAGVFSVADAARLVAGRGRLMERARGGAMLAVALDEAAVRGLCGSGVDLAAVNGAQQCVLSGEASAIAAVEARLSGQGHLARRLAVNYAFHSHLLDPALDEFESIVRRAVLQAPQRRLVSSVTGNWLSDAEARDTRYWRNQMRAPVRFWEGLRTVAGSGRVLCVEMGPGQTLSGLARAAGLAAQSVWPSGKDEEESLARALAGMWEKGVGVDWQAVHGQGRRRVVLPGIAFERQRHWLDVAARPIVRAASVVPGSAVSDDKPRLYAPVWRRWLDGGGELSEGPFLVVQGGAVGQAVSAALKASGRVVVEVEAGFAFARHDRLRFEVATSDRVDYARVLQALREDGLEPTEIVHTLAVDAADEVLLEQGLHAAHALVQGLVDGGVSGTLTVVSRSACAVTGLEAARPEAATLRSLVQVVPQEHPSLRCRGLDVTLRADDQASLTATAIVADLGLKLDQPLVARRGHQLWVPDYQELARPPAGHGLLRQGGVYLITGGLGAIGLTLAHHLAKNYRAKIALVSRKSMPAAGRLRAIEQAGGGLTVGIADVADEAAMQAFVEKVEANFGPLNGVIHAAGIVGEAARRPFAKASRADVNTLLWAKLYGTQVIEQLFAERPLDFVCLMSSLAVDLGGAGLGPYAAANCALDAFAGGKSSTPWITINWDGWQFDSSGLGIARDAAVLAWEDALAVGCAQVSVALGDFAARRARWQRPRPAPAPVTSASALRSRTESAVARAWEAVLGRSSLGPNDDFFDLGGDSLRAVQVVNRLRGDLGSEIPMRLLFEAPSVAAFAGAIDRLLAMAAPLVVNATQQRTEVEF